MFNNGSTISPLQGVEDTGSLSQSRGSDASSVPTPHLLPKSAETEMTDNNRGVQKLTEEFQAAIVSPRSLESVPEDARNTSGGVVTDHLPASQNGGVETKVGHRFVKTTNTAQLKLSMPQNSLPPYFHNSLPSSHPS